MAVPTMISMLVVVIYNMADTFFIGQTQDPLQVAAVSWQHRYYDLYGAGKSVWHRWKLGYIQGIR